MKCQICQNKVPENPRKGFVAICGVCLGKLKTVSNQVQEKKLPLPSMN